MAGEVILETPMLHTCIFRLWIAVIYLLPIDCPVFERYEIYQDGEWEIVVQRRIKKPLFRRLSIREPKQNTSSLTAVLNYQFQTVVLFAIVLEEGNGLIR